MLTRGQREMRRADLKARKLAMLRQQYLASLPATYTQLREASGVAVNTMRECLDMLLASGLVVEKPGYNGRSSIYWRAPGVPLPAVRGFVICQPADVPKPKAKGSGVIAGHAYATGYRWGASPLLF